ncbi:hypothetical protein RAN53_09570 [Halomonas sp. SSL-5]|uniref:hypothetical protein n=1 Tax=Halomonas sp. SSL-5 TaxID=3065855 RepID=UPI0027395A2F|nr:hypothetical protein [Halomonas sp. SSL-5]MDY7116598.1 hypothetical protein [Halomonas sp. SSL-5]
MSLIKKIEDAETKDQLETLGKELFGVDVDKRKGVETIRAELLELAEAQENDTTGVTDPETHAEAQAAQAEQQAAKNEEAGETKASYSGRMLKHRKTGRLFPWTAQLAKKRDMQEV